MRLMASCRTNAEYMGALAQRGAEKSIETWQENTVVARLGRQNCSGGEVNREGRANPVGGYADAGGEKLVIGVRAGVRGE